jgi:hypothetical protein
MASAQDELVRLVSEARDQAKTVLSALEQSGHPQTNESSGVFFGLVTILKQLRAVDPPPTLGHLAGELEQLVGLCTGKLASLEPLVRQAAQLARGTHRQ